MILVIETKYYTNKLSIKSNLFSYTYLQQTTHTYSKYIPHTHIRNKSKILYHTTHLYTYVLYTLHTYNTDEQNYKRKYIYLPKR